MNGKTHGGKSMHTSLPKLVREDCLTCHMWRNLVDSVVLVAGEHWYVTSVLLVGLNVERPEAVVLVSSSLLQTKHPASAALLPMKSAALTLTQRLPVLLPDHQPLFESHAGFVGSTQTWLGYKHEFYSRQNQPATHASDVLVRVFRLCVNLSG